MEKCIKCRIGRTGLRLLVVALVIVVNSSEYVTDVMEQTSGTAITDVEVPWPTSSSENSWANFAATVIIQRTSPSNEMVGNTVRPLLENSLTSDRGQRQSAAVQVFSSHSTTVSFNDLLTDLDATGSGEWRWEFSWDWNIIMQLILSLVGVFGNAMVIAVIGVRKFNSNSTDVLILALTISDLLTSLCNIPIPQASQVPASILGALYCRIILYGFLTWVCVITSTVILVGLSVERLVAVRYPLRFRKIFSIRRVYIFIVSTWLFSLLSCSYYFIDIKQMLDENFSEENNCVATASNVPSRLRQLKVFTSINFVIRLVIPVVLMIFTQIAMAYSLHLQSRRHDKTMSQKSGQSFHIRARNRIIKVMITVVIAFIICWAPSQIAWVVISFNGSAKGYLDSTLRDILNLITFINSSINPFIYTSQYPKFRAAIKEILIGKPKNNAPLFAANV
ncbi:galanin receptor 2a-like [Lytechinus variegatus]|uniref:galanin receptor 2a-like n=1 Tax=Lytechinus variegatus TaxID=7654 RepID=UPI001BB2890E|nr:galanin receptor 2a-like [Lytechinus variegatus]